MCHYCHRPLLTMKAGENITIELTLTSNSHKEEYYFDTKACMVTWVRETYGT